MDGIHDMGGMHGFGKVEPEQDEPVFHAPWEGRCLALNRAMGAIGAWTHRRGPRRHRELAAGCLFGELVLRQMGAAVWKTWSSPAALPAPTKLPPATRCDHGNRLDAQTHSGRRAAHADARLFRSPAASGRRASSSATACARKISIRQTHTRLPRYARGHVGVIEAIRGCHVFPDSRSRTARGENPQWLYTVLFDGRELWGEAGDPTLKVSIEAFEPYLDPA